MSILLRLVAVKRKVHSFFKPDLDDLLNGIRIKKTIRMVERDQVEVMLLQNRLLLRELRKEFKKEDDADYIG